MGHKKAANQNYNMPASDWNDVCPHVIVWEAKDTRDHYAKPTYLPAVTFTGRRVFKDVRKADFVRSTKGQGAESMISSVIWILGTPNVGYDDRVYVQSDTVFPPIIQVDRYPDEEGDLFVKVSLGSANG